MLSPLHAMLDERVMEITLVNYNLIDALNISLWIFTAVKDP
jgi:hypothetical protein